MFRNTYAFKSSLLNEPLYLSTYAFSVGFPGRKNNNCIRFSYPVNDFSSNFKTTSEFINKLLNGKEIFEEKSNKTFFKEDVLGGIYFNCTTEDIKIIKFIFCFEYQSNENEEQITFSIKKRIKSLLNARIESVPTYSIDKKMKAILNLSVNNLFLRFGNQKVNKTKH